MFETLWPTVKGLFVYNEEETKVLEKEGDSNLIQAHSELLTVDWHGQNVTVRAAIVPNQNFRQLGPEVVDELPLILFIHGLGGQLNQWEYQIDAMSYAANIVAIDLPGHGKSPYVEKWDLYKTDSYVEVILAVLKHEKIPPHKKVLIVGHSMGSILAVKAANLLGTECVGLVLITPAYKPMEELEALNKKKKYLYYVPTFLFEVFRSASRVGGTESPSVRSLISDHTTKESTLTRQLRTNLQSNSRTWLYTVAGIEFLTDTDLNKVSVPVLVISAEEDKLCKKESVKLLHSKLPDSAQYHEIHAAGHGVIIEKPEVVSALISDYASASVHPKLNYTWQLQHVASNTDKWSLKNESKWRETQSVGNVIYEMRGMKTLRQDDPDHSPTLLEENFPDIAAVIDISRESPPYNPQTFQRIKYIKYPTTAKIPPSTEEVEGFIHKVESLKLGEGENAAVHCHYGFNRTGFLICCYLIEKHGLSVQKAIELYKTSRPTGIHHIHFIDELHLRYNN